MSVQKKSIKITLISLLFYSLLVATHEGEYWPFSIYPMFSKAGNPWTRALVRDVSNTNPDELWETTTLDNLNGNPVSMKSIGVDQIDYSNFVSKTKEWDEKRILALRNMLGERYLITQDWMIFKVHGKMIGNDSVVVETVPILLFKSDTTLFNPNLSSNYYSSE
ncbi:MAG TPA: hypothetical protein DCL80_08560 [Balneola sp.]|jgi:hypothetical protein|nr:hypothetical protein [Balneola sp.]HAH51303.1 hypothetical protein [Balneola sp.]HAW82163.1 hypothetical protein [Balneola sp.]HBZ38617.1 hypothetical protein [Balneola sp.]|tara:strand:- start:2545 stop:3036 length:492 start_codon:yes stop_codon:yes gene_type:complete